MPSRGNLSNVAILNDIFYRGGVERILSYQTCSLFARDEGWIFLFDKSRIEFEYRGKVESLNVKAPPYRDAREEATSLARALVRLWIAKKKHRIDACISHKEGPNFINVLSGGRRRIVTVHEVKSQGIKYSGIKRRAVAAMIRTLYNRASWVVAVSQGIAEDLVQNFGIRPGKIRVILNPCDVLEVRRRAREPLPPEHEEIFRAPVVITAGRLERQKGQWHLLRAFSSVARRDPEARLVVLGDGDHLDYLTRLAADLGLASRIHFLGFQQNPFKYLARARVFALTSLWEGFPGILLEALACEVPVVSVDCKSGPREILACRSVANEDASAGILTAAVDGEYRDGNDPVTPAESQIADAIVGLLEHQDLRTELAVRGRTRVEEFGLERYAQKWQELLA